MAEYHPLAGVVEKLRRSDRHINQLYSSVFDYVKGGQYSLTPHRDLGDGKPGFTFHVLKEPPLEFSVIVGDIVHNLRCALDYLAHELTIVNGSTPTRQTMFPISLTEDDFINQCCGIGKFNGVSGRAIKIASFLQPYRRDADKRTTHPLWWLAKLSNKDKHHALALSAIGAEVTTTFHHPDGRQFVSKFDRGLVHDGAIVASIPAEFFDEKVKPHVHGTCHVAFRDEPLRDREIVNTVQILREFVGKVVLSAFEPFFEELPDDLRLKTHGLPPEIVAKGWRQ